MSKVNVRALQPFVDYKTGLRYEVGGVAELERSEFEILQALTAQVYEIVEDATASEEEQDNGEVSSDSADA